MAERQMSEMKENGTPIYKYFTTISCSEEFLKSQQEMIGICVNDVSKNEDVHKED